MTYWIVDRFLPGVLGGLFLGLLGYLKLHFDEAWPYWGRSRGGKG